MGLRLGFHYHIPAELSGDGLIRVQGPLGRFLDSIASECEALICFQHSPWEGDIEADYTLKADNVKLVGIGPHTRIPRRSLFALSHTRPIRSFRDHLDAFLIRAPTPLLKQVASSARPLPTILMLVGDYTAGIDSLNQPWWRKELIRIWASSNKRAQDRIAARSLTLVNSRLLYEEYRGRANQVAETRTTTLTEDDFCQRTDACAKPPFCVLFCGRLDSGKGLMDIAEAVRILRERGTETIFELAGPRERGDDILEKLEEFAGINAIPLTYYGHRPLGRELFELYERADLFVTASQSSEGFPRTIWEAMAHSLPVVATGVGSIPHYLEDQENALLCTPGEPSHLASQIERIVFDSDLRSRLVANGFELARTNTLSARAKEMVSTIEEWLDSRDEQ